MVLFWGGNFQPMATRIFLLQKKVIRIILGVDSRFSCKGLFKKLDILVLPIPCEYVFSVLTLIIKNFDNFLIITAVHGVNTRTKHKLHRRTVPLS